MEPYPFCELYFPLALGADLRAPKNRTQGIQNKAKD